MLLILVVISSIEHCEKSVAEADNDADMMNPPAQEFSVVSCFAPKLWPISCAMTSAVNGMLLCARLF
jgi:hypothetical protein